MSLSRRLGFPTNSLFSGFDDFFSPPSFSQDFAAVPFLTDVRRDPDMVLRRSSPCYEVTENDKQYQLAIDVPGVKLKDIEIELEQDRVLRISGGRKVHKTDDDGTVSTSESKFEKRFVMDQSIDTSKVSANLQDGVLTITAPKNIEHSKVHKIAITEGPSPMITEGDNPQTSK
jgi:Molecular chaperone (small heat shock protein)